MKSAEAGDEDDRTAARGVIDEKDAETIEDRSALRTPLIYEIVRRLGEEEMERPATSLWWSGLAAGLSISFSLLAQGILYAHLPDAPWRPLLSSLGYSVGFLMVVMARQQLFTESTITVVLPVMADFSMSRLVRLGRLWGIVFAANMVGTGLAAVFCTFTPVLTPDLTAAMQEISRHAMEGTPVAMFFRAISAGFLMAAMVWLIPTAESSKFHIITLMTYLIAVGGFAHVVAGSVEAFLLVASGQLSIGTMVTSFTIPVVLGNIVGGTALFALLSYAQVMKEI